MNSPLLKQALTSAQAAAVCRDKSAFVVAVRVAQSQMSQHLDLVRALDASIQAFPDGGQLRKVYETALID